jgi:hypothetical protein
VIAAPLYLFEYGDTDHFGLSRDMTGCNLPKDGHPWLLRGEVTAEELKGNLTPAVDEVEAKGFCVFQLTEHELD